MDKFLPNWIRKPLSMISNERGEVEIPFLETVSEGQRESVTQFVQNTGVSQEDLQKFDSFDSFLTGYKPPAPQGSWQDNLDDGGKALLTTKGWKSPADVLKGYSELEKFVGHEKIPMPKKDANGNWEKGELERVMMQLGLPSDASGYKTPDLKLPDGATMSEELATAFKERARTEGRLLPSQYEFVMKEYAELLSSGSTEMKAQQEKAFNESVFNLKAKLGLAYDTKVAMAHSLLYNYAGDENKANELTQKYGNDPLIQELLINVSADLSEESLHKANMANSILDPASAKMEIAKIRTERADELQNESHPQHKFWMAKLEELYRIRG